VAVAVAVAVSWTVPIKTRYACYLGGAFKVIRQWRSSGGGAMDEDARGIIRQACRASVGTT
jgi:hypothetical protein